MKLVYAACCYQDPETGNYTVEVPDLPGCVTGASTLADAILMAQDAASGWILGELEDGNTIPAAAPINTIQADEGGFVSLLTLDMDTYTEKYGKKAVRKNLTLPAWLNTFGENQHINFSQVFTDAMTAIFQKTQQTQP